MGNYKIHATEINSIVDFLESKGLKLTFKLTDNPEWVTINNGGYGFFNFNPVNFHEEISFNELKEILNDW